MNVNERRLDAVLFDLDGTLLDTAPDFHRALSHLRQQEGLPELDYSLTLQTASNGAAALIAAAFEHSPESADFQRLHQQLLDYYLAHIAVATRPYDGIPELLDWLDQEQIPWGVVTNKPERFTLPLLEQLQLKTRCAAIVCPDHVSERKPHPEPLFLACRHIGCQPADTVYIGDHGRDIEAGINAGMTTVAALYGYLEADAHPADWHASHQVDDARLIQPWLTQFAHTR